MTVTEERIKCECCDELFTRSLYDKHWEALSLDPTRAWRYVPLDQIMPTSRLLDDLKAAGYETAGDVLSVEPSDLEADVYGVGPMRAIWLRQKVFDYVKPFGSQGEPQWVLVDPKHEIEETTPSAADAIATLCSIVAVGLIVYLLAWMAL